MNEISKLTKSYSQIYAEGMREMGVLLMVFGPMYLIFETAETGWRLYGIMLVWFVFGLALFQIGAMLERRSL